MDYSKLMKMAILAGEIMLKSGAETYRAEDTMEHILKTSDMSYVEIHATITGIMATINDASLDQPITMISRVKDRATDLNQITQINDISRRYCGGETTLDEAFEELQFLEKTPYRKHHYGLAIVLIVVGFAVMFGGGITEVAGAIAVGGVLALSVYGCQRLHMDPVIQDIISSFILSVMAILMKIIVFPGMQLDAVIIAGIMPLVPGVAITNAVRDTLQGDYVSGSARILEAFLKAAAIAIGAGVGMLLYGKLI